MEFLADLISGNIAALAVLIAWLVRSPVDSKIVRAILKLVREVIDKILTK